MLNEVIYLFIYKVKELEKTRAEMKCIQDENDKMKTFIQEMSKIEEEKRLTQLEIERLKKEVQKSNELLLT